MWSSHTMRTVLTDTKTWTRAETRLGRRAARPLLVLGIAGIALAVVQAWCAALILGRVVAAGEVRPVALSLPYAPGSWLPLFGFTVAGLVRAAVNFASGVRAASVGADARRRLRSGALARVLAAGPALLRNRATGDLLTTLVDGIEGADGFYARWLPAASLASVGPALVLLAVLLADRRAALVLLIGGLAVPVFQAIFGIGAAAASRRQFTALSRLQNRFLDRIRGVSTIVLAGAAADEERALGRAADELRRRTMRVLRVAFLSSAALDCAQAACLVLIAVADRHLLLGHPTPWGAARAVFALLAVPEFFAPLRAFALAYQDRHRIAGAAGELASLPALPEVPAAPAAVRNVEAHGVTIAFEGVGFTWDAARGRVLDGLSFRAPAGETTLLIGPSGAGKSTILAMLLGFVRPEHGRITINGADLATVVPAALSRMTAWIGQRPVLFAGTMRENILFGRPDARAEELAAAVRAARLDALVESLPAGLETRVGEGGHGLSGGQAQRVAIARAFLKNAPLLLLDEPTAHLDPATEAEVFESLRRLALGRTVILASHASAAHAFAGRRIEITPHTDAEPKAASA